MKIKIKHILLISIVLLISVLIFNGGISSKKGIEHRFYKNEECFSIIADYLSELPYSDIYINKSELNDLTMFAGLEHGYIPIQDTDVVNALCTLFDKKICSVIGRYENTIHFQCHTRGMDFGSGIAYSIDGAAPILQFLTYTEDLPNSQWYYYEEDFNKYKMDHQATD